MARQTPRSPTGMVAVSGGVDGVTVTNILQQDTTVKETIRGK
jgi:predicted PP-loop superfamily ATPase